MRPRAVYSWTTLLQNTLIVVLGDSLFTDAGSARSRHLCDNHLLGFLTHRGEATAVAKRTGDRLPRDNDQELASVPWQTLWLMESTKQDCGFQEVVLRMNPFPEDLRTADWLMKRPEHPIGHCPVRFRPHVDPHRWFPRNLVVSECLCEGSPCARHGLHVCVTAFAARYVYSLYTGKKRVLIAVGCICAIQKTRLAKVIAPDTPD